MELLIENFQFGLSTVSKNKNPHKRRRPIEAKIKQLTGLYFRYQQENKWRGHLHHIPSV